MAKQLEVSPEEILFVGNSHKFDVKGAKAAGMKSAWFVSRISSLFHKKSDQAEITFCSYPKLQRMLLGK
jgi:putative hydrolase of the HAD superfamily